MLEQIQTLTSSGFPYSEILINLAGDNLTGGRDFPEYVKKEMKRMEGVRNAIWSTGKKTIHYLIKRIRKMGNQLKKMGMEEVKWESVLEDTKRIAREMAEGKDYNYHYINSQESLIDTVKHLSKIM